MWLKTNIKSNENTTPHICISLMFIFFKRSNDHKLIIKIKIIIFHRTFHVLLEKGKSNKKEYRNIFKVWSIVLLNDFITLH